MTTPGISSFNPEQAFQENGALHFFFLDASEVKNVVYLFGKVKYANCFISCSLSVHNIERNVFLLPREYILSKGAKTDVKVEPIDVYNEFSNLRANFKIKKFASKFVDRKYSFEVPGVPDQAVWLKVAYSFNDPPLPSNFSGDTFSHAFGTTTSALELFLLKRHLMGPCWLYIDKPSMNTPSFSWSKLEGMVTNPKQVSVLKSPPPPPPLTLMAISSKCCLNEKNQQELLILTAVTFSTSFADDRKMEPVHHLTVARSPPGSMMIPMISTNEIKVHQNEKSLVNQFMANLQVQDPDILLGHNLVGFDVDLLMSRLKFMNHSGWSKVGRLRRAHFPKATYYRQFFSGRLLLDTYLAAKELIASSKSYSLNFLASTQLKKNRVDLDFSTIRSLFDSPDTVRGLLEYSFQDCILAVELAVHLNCISLYKQLSTICGSLLSRTMVSGRAERNEYLLLHEFHKGKFIVPDKDTTFNLTAKPIENEVDLADEMEGTGLNNIEDINESKNETTTTAPATSTSKRKKPQYAGGLVLEPKKGFYDSFVLLLDFNSLYPSIIQEYNICYTTVIRTEDQTMPSVPVQKEVGLLPRLIKSLVDRRKAVKKLMKDCPSHERNQYNIRQLALKLTANSMYGCLGFLHSRFYCKPLAMLITKLGRDILQDTVDLANQNGMNVIYGDTDSIMIHTGTLELHQVKQIGRNLQDLVNKKYKHLEIEMDGFFERMLLLKKKKYAALVLEEGIDGKLTRRIESKGLDLVRRDWCELSHDVSSFILHQLLESQESKEQVLLTIHEYLKDVAQKVREFHYPIEAFVITKSLTKHPKLYTDQQPHVSVALAMEERGEPVTVGSTVPYVICTSQEKALSSRARHPTDFQRDPSLRIDVEWYVAQQIFPPVARLCSEMEGSEQAHLAECLGLDSRKYDTFGTSQNSGQGIQTLESLLSLEERFANVEPLPLLCLTCSTPFVMNQSYATPSYTVGWTCPQCSQPLALSTLSAQVTHALRQQILRYENKWLVCDDISCQCRSRSIRVYPARCWRSPECRGKVMLEYSANQLYRQLTFFSYLFDVERMLKPTNSSNLSTEVIVLLHSHKEHYLTIHRLIQRYLDRNARMRVDLGTLFSFVRTTL
ncbi:DNA polymerase alpha catalytic subunit [Coelomomyces lativittatus]|nr:DNA polymerase alpha catalytic subunit [Coelomomyces lativittatus]